VNPVEYSLSEKGLSLLRLLMKCVNGEEKTLQNRKYKLTRTGYHNRSAIPCYFGVADLVIISH
jgi:DNA-binding HxlR family transcriptional regulator